MVLLAACSGDPRRPAELEPVPLMRLPESHLQKCRSFPAVAPVCPEEIPVVETDAGRAQAFRSGKGHFVFFSEWGAPYPGLSPKNAPPRFIHLVIHAGDLSSAFPFEWPERTNGLPDPIPKKRRPPLLLENVTWSGIQGQLLLAPPFPMGGLDGDHVIFRWSEDDRDYALSLHAWTPVAETLDALKEIVSTIAP